jgi:hypothetical protein
MRNVKKYFFVAKMTVRNMKLLTPLKKLFLLGTLPVYEERKRKGKKKEYFFLSFAD